MTGTMTDDCLHRFLFDDLDIRGALVRLGPVMERAMIENRAYPAPVAQLLGEMSATTVLLGASSSSPGA